MRVSFWRSRSICPNTHLRQHERAKHHPAGGAAAEAERAAGRGEAQHIAKQDGAAAEADGEADQQLRHRHVVLNDDGKRRHHQAELGKRCRAWRREQMPSAARCVPLAMRRMRACEQRQRHATVHGQRAGSAAACRGKGGEPACHSAVAAHSEVARAQRRRLLRGRVQPHETGAGVAAEQRKERQVRASHARPVVEAHCLLQLRRGCHASAAQH